MDNIGIAVGVLGVSFILIFIWMISLSMRKRRLKMEKEAKELAYHKALQRMREQEKKDRLFKAESGHVPTMLYLAKEAERDNLKEAFFWYEKAALQDDRNGIFGLIRLGKRISNNVLMEERVHFWETYIRALDGDLAAKIEVGKLLTEGRGTEVNVERGLMFMKEAAEQNSIEAILFMADWCTSRNNLTPSASDANYWLYKAIKLRDSTAMMKLGLHYLQGIGVASNHRKACYWLERAAEHGHSEAMFHAGHAWMDYGTHGNEIAYIWFFLSAMFNYEPAKVVRDTVGGKIGVESVVGLQSLTKPLYKKIVSKEFSEHAVIRVLNKLYKRPIPLLEQEESDDPSAFDHLSSELEATDLQEVGGDSDGHLGKNEAGHDGASSEKASNGPSLDFTQKHF